MILAVLHQHYFDNYYSFYYFHNSFPGLCRDHGGLTFLFIYSFLTISLVIPINYLETIIGQFTRGSMVTQWRLCPFFKGQGISLIICLGAFSIQYTMFVSVFLQYTVNSITETYIWAKCNNTWNTPECNENEDTQEPNRTIVRASEEYFRLRILHEEWVGNRGYGKSIYTLKNLGRPVPGLVMNNFIIYAIALIFVCFGTRYVGRILHFSTPIPILFLTILSFRGMSLSGAYLGLIQYVKFDTTELYNVATWRNAIILVLATSQSGQGVYTTFASYNPFNRRILKPVIITVLLNITISMVSGCVVFSLIGFSQFVRHKNLLRKETKVSDEAIMFEVMPEAFASIPPHVGGSSYVFLYFSMIFLNSFDNIICIFDVLTTSILDLSPKFLSKHFLARRILAFIIVICTSLMCIVFTTPATILTVAILERSFGGKNSVVICAFIFLFAITIIFGEGGMKFAVERMTGNSNWFGIFRVVWIFYTLPVLGLLSCFMGYVDSTTIPFHRGNTELVSAAFIVPILNYTPLVCIPLGAIYVMVKFRSPKFLLAISPEHEHEKIKSTGTGVRSNWIKFIFRSIFKSNEFHPEFLLIYEEAIEKKVKNENDNDEVLIL